MKIHHPKGTGSREAGYNLVVLMVAITVLNILIAAALPLWSRIIQHDKEEELIFRGMQYAEAIRVFHNRFQRAPVRLEELLEAKPRCIRQLWKDPMTKDGKWKVLYENVQQPGAPLVRQGPKDGREEGGDNGEETENPQDENAFLTTKQKDELTIGPIEGVASRSNKKSAAIWSDQERYDQWQFRWTLLVQGAAPPPAGGQQGVPGQPGQLGLGESARWIGRPLPKSLGLQNSVPIPPSGLPGDTGKKTDDGKKKR